MERCANVVGCNITRGLKFRTGFFGRGRTQDVTPTKFSWATLPNMRAFPWLLLNVTDCTCEFLCVILVAAADVEYWSK